MTRGLLAAGCLSLGLVSSTGCTAVSGVGRALHNSDCIDECMIGYRNRALAEKAWHCEKHRFGHHQNLRDLRAGFIDGYIEVASGGPGCCPTLAPNRYWGWKYQTGYGQQAVNAWFEGYPLGVQAAEEDGLGHTNTIRTNNMYGAAPPMLAPAVPGGVMIPGDMPMQGQMPVPDPQTDGDVTNPFYSEPEVIPAPETIDAGEASPAAEPTNQLDLGPNDAALTDPVGDMPIAQDTAEEEPELVRQSELVKSHQAAVSASLGDLQGYPVDGEVVSEEVFTETPASDYEATDFPETDFPEPAEVVIDDLFGSPETPVNTSTDSEELPFTFE